MSRVSMRPGQESRRTCEFGPRKTALGHENCGAAPLLVRPRKPQPIVPLPTRRALGQESRGAAPLSVRPPKPQPIVPLPTGRACVACVCVCACVRACNAFKRESARDRERYRAHRHLAMERGDLGSFKGGGHMSGLWLRIFTTSAELLGSYSGGRVSGLRLRIFTSAALIKSYSGKYCATTLERVGVCAAKLPSIAAPPKHD
jgi:hypothetical protein